MSAIRNEVKKNAPIKCIETGILTISQPLIKRVWSVIPPAWSLQNIIAVNPLSGLEGLSFEEAITKGTALFRMKDIPKEVQQANRLSIKWLQHYFDQGQSTLSMPLRHKGLLNSIASLLLFEPELKNKTLLKKIHQGRTSFKGNEVIITVLEELKITKKKQELFLTLALTTLSGWSSHIQYLANWSPESNENHNLQSEFLALRVLLIALCSGKTTNLVDWFETQELKVDERGTINKIIRLEEEYRQDLLTKIATHCSTHKSSKDQPKAAQFVFCIDARSESIRQSIEGTGAYETFGFAGFFGVPVSLKNVFEQESYASCPVLIKPSLTINQTINKAIAKCEKGFHIKSTLKKIYQSAKYTFLTPFCLVESLGFFSGLWMALKTISPNFASQLTTAFNKATYNHYQQLPNISKIPLEKQVTMSESALTTMGLTDNFAPFIFLCAHSSSTENNAYETALNCGACAGNNGLPNASILTDILNSNKVRSALKEKGIKIPESSLFIASLHNTTTDEISIMEQKISYENRLKLEKIKDDLTNARLSNCLKRSKHIESSKDARDAANKSIYRSRNWSEVRPEWGLAKNAAFIIGPRSFTQHIDLKGRAFLHSYNWEKDRKLSALTTILTAPMIVAQWINAQYLFSTLDNVAFGGGSKVTKNITGKIGIMQGNASDLMNGLPLQSINSSDHRTFHDPIRLQVVVYAPREGVLEVITQHQLLETLFINGWIHLHCQDPKENCTFNLTRTLKWQAHK